MHLLHQGKFLVGVKSFLVINLFLILLTFSCEESIFHRYTAYRKHKLTVKSCLCQHSGNVLGSPMIRQFIQNLIQNANFHLLISMTKSKRQKSPSYSCISLFQGINHGNLTTEGGGQCCQVCGSGPMVPF